MPESARNTTASRTADLAFFDETIKLLQELQRTQADSIRRAGELCADRIARGGLVFLFGNGHSRMMCEEMTPRQGCYAGFVALVETALSNHAAIVGANGLRAPLYLENYEGYAEQILESFHFMPTLLLVTRKRLFKNGNMAWETASLLLRKWGRCARAFTSATFK